jgi:Activator of Hsp90 ATPase homolog 1-like protein
MTSNAASIEPVVKILTVPCTVEEAFRYFTADFSMWWPAATHSVVAYASGFKDQPAAVIFESRAGGRIFERAPSGEEHIWGSVLAWQPPARVAFSFHPGRDPKECQTVEVLFSAAPEGARVVLTHSGWEKLGVHAQKTRDDYNQGWERVIAAYGEHIQNRNSA